VGIGMVLVDVVGVATIGLNGLAIAIVLNLVAPVVFGAMVASRRLRAYSVGALIGVCASWIVAFGACVAVLNSV
jgi:ABC-type uncharacterized transport system permease subunit